MAGRLAARRPARLALAAGLGLAALAQLTLPIGWPIYDSVSVVAPYRYLNPVAGSGEIGAPTSYDQDVAVAGAQSPVLTAATGESPPQAQVIATAGAFAVPSGTTSLHVTITPVQPAAAVPSGAIAGNVYRIAVTDSGGKAVPAASGQQITVAMRGPGFEANGVVMRYAGGAWSTLPSQHDPNLAIYTVEVTDLGDFAVVDLGTGITVTTILIAATVGVVVAAMAIFGIRTWLRRRSAAEAAHAAQAAEAARSRAGRSRSSRRDRRGGSGGRGGGGRPTSRRG